MLLPPYLQPGDVIAVVATARSVTLADLQEGINLAKAYGFQVIVGASIGLVHHQFAGNDLERAADLQAQINNPAVKGIWCAKGGYGSVRILDLVDFSSLRTHPKWIIGYSDVTALHGHLQSLGLASLHAQMPVGVKQKSQASAATLFQVLQGKPQQYAWKTHVYSLAGSVTGIVVGGNLSVVYSLVGSSSFPSCKGMILLLEDVDEYLYHIDRMMQNLQRNGVLQGLAGIIVGGFTEMKDNAIPFGQNAYQIILSYVCNLGIPVAFGAPLGHQVENLALPLGKSIQLEVGQEMTHIHF